MHDSDVVARPVRRERWATAGWPLGAHLDDRSGVTTFAVHSPAATRVLLEIYPEATGADACLEVEMAQTNDGVWCAAVAGLAPGALYAFRAWGENWLYDPAWRRGGSAAGFHTDLDTHGNRFNPNKVLFDPYAREITHVPKGREVRLAGAREAIFLSGTMPYGRRPAREADTGRVAPKGVLVEDHTSTGSRPRYHDEASLIYEGHVKNLTMHPSAAQLGDLLSGTDGFSRVVNVPDELRGTYAGVGYLAPYLRSLGVTAIELMPVHETDTDQRGPVQGTVNHWGYQTLGFFAPNRDYAHDQTPGGPTREFKEMVARLHAGGIEVVLDVVYNHSGEGGEWYSDPASTAFTSLGGFGAAEYYVLSPDLRLVDGATGTSNQMNFSSWASRQLVLDSLSYWHEEMGVDGFRFDLAPVLGRRPHATSRDDWSGQRRFFRDHPLLLSVRNLAATTGFDIIAEPWDLWGYELGNFPSGWLEWSGRFRDACRRFLKGDGNAPEFAAEFAPVTDGPTQRELHNAVNFIDAHDGFMMMDLVSFNTKHNNDRPPFGPSDGGTDDNLSWDSGQDHSLRRTRWRNAWLTTLLGRGIPMVVAGDEYGRTQNGNNNPWNLNTVGIWNNWAQAASSAPTRVPVLPGSDQSPTYYDVVGPTDAIGFNPLLRFARYTARMRRGDVTFIQTPWGINHPRHDVPYRFTTADQRGVPQQGDRALSVLIDGREVGGHCYLFCLNQDAVEHSFALPPMAGPWLRLVDTGAWAEGRANVWEPEEADEVTDFYGVHAWSTALLRLA